ncbi:MAG TPA: redoxin domain-containing protein [Anaerolineales bacterium]
MDYSSKHLQQRRQRKAIVSFFLDPTSWLTILMVAIILGSCSPIQQPAMTVKPGVSAPDFTLKSVRGGTYSLKDKQRQAVLLSFLNTQAKGTSDESDPSRAQIVFLKSMQEQYTAQGLNVWIVDATQQVTGKQPSLDELINFTYNWQLDLIPVLMDERASVATTFGVASTPTTFLIGPDGVIQQRWDSVAFSAQLALAIESIVGADFKTPNEMSTCPNESLPQAKFAGVGLARPLSNEIWVVDNGKPWGVGGNFPLQWIVIDSQNKSEAGDLHLQVTAHHPDSENDVVLVDQDLQLLPEEEAHGLLIDQNNDVSKIFFLVTTIRLNQSGCIQLHAAVTKSHSDSFLYEGDASVPVR